MDSSGGFIFEVTNAETADAVAEVVVDSIVHHPHNVYLCTDASRRRTALDTIVRRSVRECAQSEFGRVFAVLDGDGEVVGASVWAGIEPRVRVSGVGDAVGALHAGSSSQQRGSDNDDDGALWWTPPRVEEEGEERAGGGGEGGGGGGGVAHAGGLQQAELPTEMERRTLQRVAFLDVGDEDVALRCKHQCDDNADDYEECCEERCDHECYEQWPNCYEGCCGATAGVWRCALDRRRCTMASVRTFARQREQCDSDASRDREAATESCRRFCACTDENCGEGICDTEKCDKNRSCCSANGCAAGTFCCWTFWTRLAQWFSLRSIAASLKWLALFGWCTWVVATATTLKLVVVLGLAGVRKRYDLVIELRRMRRRAAREVAREVATLIGVESINETGAERWKREQAMRPQLLNLVYLVVRPAPPPLVGGGGGGGSGGNSGEEGVAIGDVFFDGGLLEDGGGDEDPNSVRATLLAAIETCGPFRFGARVVVHCSSAEEQAVLERLGFSELAHGQVHRGTEVCPLRTLGLPLQAGWS